MIKLFTDLKSYNLANGDDSLIYLSLITATLLLECCFITAYRYYPEYFGYIVNIIYTQFNLTVVIVDILVMLISFGITQQCYNFIFGKSHWNLLYFIIIFIIYQLFRNFIYYIIVEQWIPKGYNKLLDIQLSYYTKYTLRTLLGDVMIAIVLPCLVLYFRNSKTSSLFDTIIISVYFICYLLLSSSATTSSSTNTTAAIPSPTPAINSFNFIQYQTPTPIPAIPTDINNVSINELNSNPFFLRNIESK
jgi:hypothetical protein